MSETNNEYLDWDDDEDEEFSKDDFGFIISPDGELKSVMFPDKLMDDPPAEILEILKIFGIKDFNEIGNNTIH